MYRDKTDSGQFKLLVLIWWTLIGTHLVSLSFGTSSFCDFCIFCDLCVSPSVSPCSIIFSQEWLTLRPLRPLWNRWQSRRRERRRTRKPDLSDLTKTWGVRFSKAWKSDPKSSRKHFLVFLETHDYFGPEKHRVISPRKFTGGQRVPKTFFFSGKVL